MPVGFAVLHELEVVVRYILTEFAQVVKRHIDHRMVTLVLVCLLDDCVDVEVVSEGELVLREVILEN